MTEKTLTPKEIIKLTAAFEQMKQMAADDPVYFFDHFLYTFDPKTEPFHLKFITFPFQKRLIRDIVKAIRDGEDIFIEKTRQMGISYTVAGVFLWLWLFEPASNLLVGSRKEEYVDNRKGGLTGNKDESLFGKIDYMLTRLPEFMLPKGFNREKHFNYMALANPENGNVISGESANANFSRGSNRRAILLDEFAFWDYDATVWGATADATKCRIVVTTPGNRPCKAKRLRFGKDGEKIKVITLPYNLDPRKNKAWLEDQRARRSVEDFNREIMINWELSMTGRVYPEIENANFGDFPLIPGAPAFYSWDFGLDGVAICFWQRNTKNGKWRLVDSYTNEDKPIQFYLPLFRQAVVSSFTYNDQDLEAIALFKDYPPGIHFGDPDVNKRSILTGTSTRDELAKAKVYVQSIGKNDFYTRREATKLFLQNGVEINNTPRNDFFLEAVKSARYPERKETSQATTEIALPIHDWCLAGNTKIRTLNGWKEIKDLVGKKPYVWSYSELRRKLVPTQVAGCYLVNKQAETILVGLDNGNEIRCTPNHLFMLREGIYRRADELKEGDSLMPFYESDNRGYVKIQLNDGSFGNEHQLVYSEFYGVSDQDNHIHHIDGNKFNNNPDNLVEITPMEHCSETFKGVKNSERKKDKIEYQPYSCRNKIYKKCRFCGKEFLGDHKTFYCCNKCYKDNEKQQLKERSSSDEEYKKLAKKINKDYEERHKITCQFCGYKRSRKTKNCPQCHNHKVRFVKKDFLKIPVYDLEVPQYHNFVAEGVITHNTSHPRTSMEYFAVNIEKFESFVDEEPDWAKRKGYGLTSRKKY